MGRHDPVLTLAQQFPKHIAESKHRPRRHAVRARKAAAAALRSLEHGEIRAKDERRPVDQKDMVALLQLARRDGYGHGLLRMYGVTLAIPPRARCGKPAWGRMWRLGHVLLCVQSNKCPHPEEPTEGRRLAGWPRGTAEPAAIL